MINTIVTGCHVKGPKRTGYSFKRKPRGLSAPGISARRRGTLSKNNKSKGLTFVPIVLFNACILWCTISFDLYDMNFLFWRF